MNVMIDNAFHRITHKKRPRKSLTLSDGVDRRRCRCRRRRRRRRIDENTCVYFQTVAHAPYSVREDLLALKLIYEMWFITNNITERYSSSAHFDRILIFFCHLTK